MCKKIICMFLIIVNVLLLFGCNISKGKEDMSFGEYFFNFATLGAFNSDLETDADLNVDEEEYDHEADAKKKADNVEKRAVKANYEKIMDNEMTNTSVYVDSKIEDLYVDKWDDGKLYFNFELPDMDDVLYEEPAYTVTFITADQSMKKKIKNGVKVRVYGVTEEETEDWPNLDATSIKFLK